VWETKETDGCIEDFDEEKEPVNRASFETFEKERTAKRPEFLERDHVQVLEINH